MIIIIPINKMQAIYLREHIKGITIPHTGHQKTDRKRVHRYVEESPEVFHCLKEFEDSQNVIFDSRKQ